MALIENNTDELSDRAIMMLMASFGYGNPLDGMMGSFALIVLFIATSAISAGATLFLVLVMLHIFAFHVLRLIALPFIGDPLPGPESSM